MKYALKSLLTPELNDKKFNIFSRVLWESKAFYDNLYLGRIIVGYPMMIKGSEFDEKIAASMLLVILMQKSLQKPLLHFFRKELLKNTLIPYLCKWRSLKQ